MALLKHIKQHTALVGNADGHCAEHLLPSMPDQVVAVVHPVHVPGPVGVKAIPAAVEAYGVRRV